MSIENKNQNMPANDEIDLKELFLFALRKWYIFAIALFVCVSLASIYYLCKAPQYKTTATILIRSNDPMSFLSGGLNIAGVEATDLVDMPTGVEDEIEILKSKLFVGQMITELDMRTNVFVKKQLRYMEAFKNSPLEIVYPDDYEKNMRGSLKIDVEKDIDDGTYTFEFERRILDDKFKEKYTVASLDEPIVTPWGEFRFVEHSKRVKWFDPESDGDYDVRFYLSSFKSQVESLQRQIKVALVSKKTNAITLEYVSGSPRKSEAMLSKLIELYNRNAVLEKNIVAVQLSTTIDERLKVIDAELAAAEDEFQLFCAQNDIADIKKQSELLLETVRTYEEQMATIDVQNSLISFLESYLATAEDNDLIPSNTGINDPALAEMFTLYNELILKYIRMSRSTNDANPVVEQTHQQIVLMRQNIIKSIGNAKKNLEITRSDLEKQSNVYLKQVDDMPELARQYLSVSRRQNIQQSFYLAMLQKREQINMALAAASEAARVIDPPYTQERKVAPSLMKLMAFAVMLGFAAGAGILFLIYMFSNKVADKKDLRTLTDANYLGSIPFVKGDKLVVDSHTLIAEAFRNIRANLKFVLKSLDQKIIMVTSSIAGEGKSLCSTNLALSLAALDKRVAIVGLDVRNPMLANTLGMRGSRGVVGYLQDESLTETDIVQTAPQNGQLHVYVAGRVPNDPAEVLNSPRLDKFFAYLRENYDYIIVDSAPIGIVSDTLLFSNLADVVVYVTRQGVTPREYVKGIAQLVEEGKLKNVSVVLNAVPESEMIAYGYGYGNRNKNQ